MPHAFAGRKGNEMIVRRVTLQPEVIDHPAHFLGVNRRPVEIRRIELHDLVADFRHRSQRGRAGLSSVHPAPRTTRCQWDAVLRASARKPALPPPVRSRQGRKRASPRARRRRGRENDDEKAGLGRSRGKTCPQLKRVPAMEQGGIVEITCSIAAFSRGRKRPGASACSPNFRLTAAPIGRRTPMASTKSRASRKMR